MRKVSAVLRNGVPLLTSALALALTLALADLDALRNLHTRVNWRDLPVVMVLVIGIIVAFGWRWSRLFRASLPMRRSVLISALGLAGNQVLPLRGGDALRVVLSSRRSHGGSLHAAVSALAMEKVFDLIAVAAFGLAAAATITTDSRGPGLDMLVIALVILAISAIVLVAAGSGALNRGVHALARTVRLTPRWYRHVARPIHHLRRLSSPARIAALLLQTGLIWIGLYVCAYLAVASLVGVPLSPGDAMVLLFAAALGLAIPAAPSGIGTFHAAIVSAFLLLERPTADGLVLAVAIHGVFLVGFCCAGAVALAFASREVGPVRIARGGA